MTKHALIKRARLAGLCAVGLATVSIPVTIAVSLSAAGASDVLSIGEIEPAAHASTAEPVAAACRARSGYYALTFDEGPLPGATPRLVAALRRAGAVATFFDVGERAAAEPELVNLQRGAGQVANHGYSHVDLTTVSQERRLQELTATAAVLGHPNALFRPAYGATSAEVDADIRRSGLTSVFWTVDAGDLAGDGVEQVVDRAVRVKPGGIVLMHENAPGVAEAIPPIVARLKARGMCPGRIGTSATAVRGIGGRSFKALAVKP